MKIAIVKLSAMGDIIHAMVGLQFIKAQYPNIQIDWVVEEVFAPILESNSDIDNIIIVNLKKLKKKKSLLFHEIKKLLLIRKNDYDLVIDAQGLLKSAIVSRLIGKNVVGFDKNSIRESIASLFYTQKFHIPYHENTIIRNLQILTKPLDINVNHDQIINKAPFLFFKAQRVFHEDYLLFVIGSTWESRNYPKEKFATLADLLQQQIYIVWGNEEEHHKAQWIAQHTKYAKVLPKTSLDELKSIIAFSKLLIGNDTGPTHMAWGLNIPSITIFGPTPVSRVYETPINKVIKSDSIVNPYKLNKNDFSICTINEHDIFELTKGIY